MARGILHVVERRPPDMDIRDEVLDELLDGYERPEDLLGDDGLLKRLKKALIERALGAS
jgi:putative transposase